jgi:tetrathionate reductase subunit B
VDKHICIGCRYCMMACPYKARSFVHEDTTGQKPYAPRGKGTVEACTLCVHRVDAGRIPACVEACSKDGHKAMTFGNLQDPESDIRKHLAGQPSTNLRPDLRLNTGWRYTGI